MYIEFSLLPPPSQDVSDLFGSDLPVEGEPGWCFQWRDGPFLKALRCGDWIILDEVHKQEDSSSAFRYQSSFVLCV